MLAPAFRHCLLLLGVFCFWPLVVAQAQPPAAQERDLPRERMEWFYQQRAYPLGHIPAGARLRALEQLERMREAEAARSKRQPAGAPGIVASTTQWTLIGPQPTNSPFSVTPVAGRVSALAVDPRNANVVYLGGAQGGVWKTTDGGLTWTPLTDTQPSLAIGSIALDPSNPDIVYVGTGEEVFSGDSYYGAGILKSTDGGATWTHLPGTITNVPGITSFVGPFSDVFSPGGGARIGSLAVHPTNGQILLAAVQIFVSIDTGLSSGIYRSTDGGVNWTNVLPGAAGTEVVFHPTIGNIAYAALGTLFGDPDNSVYTSTDAGLTWTRIGGTGTNVLPSNHSSCDPPNQCNVGRIEIALAPSNPTTLYAGIQNAASSASFGTLLGFFKTTDAGLNWTPLLNTPDYCTPQCWYDHVLRVHPTDANIVFAGGSATGNGTLMRSLDAGASWSNISQGPNGVRLHVDQHALAFSAGATKFYVGNDGGVWSTLDAAAPTLNWANLNAALAITQFYPGHAFHPTDPNIGFGGTQDNGTQKYTGGLAWDLVTCGDGGWAAIDAVLPSTVYTTCQRIDIRKSTSNGLPFTWLSADAGIDPNDRGQFIPPLVMDPSDPQRLYFGTFRVYQTTNGAASWTPISPALTGGTLSTIAVAPSNPDVVYVGLNRGGAQITTNATAGIGASWTDRSSGLPPRFVSQIAIDPTNPMTAYVTFSGFCGDGPGFSPGDSCPAANRGRHVFKTTDGGASWTDISGNLPNIPVNDIVVDPDLPDTLYVGTDVGVFITNDGGASWATLVTGLPRVAVFSLKLHAASRTLRASTHGRSVWDLSVAIPTGVPTLSSLAPTSASAGGSGFSLTVRGSGFSPTSVVRWNGADRPTTFVSTVELRAAIRPADLAIAGTAQVAVFNPGTGGGTSNAVSFAITDFTLGIAPPSRTVAAGGPATYTLTLTPQFGSFDNTVALACSVPVPSLTSCFFSPRTLTPGATPAPATLTVSTTAPASAFLLVPSFDANPPLYALWLGAPALLLLGLALVALTSHATRACPEPAPPVLSEAEGSGVEGWSRGVTSHNSRFPHPVSRIPKPEARSPSHGLVPSEVEGPRPTGHGPPSTGRQLGWYLFLALAFLALHVACGTRHRPRTAAGTYTITITATAGPLQHSTSAALTVQ